jgi:hypothetical protein
VATAATAATAAAAALGTVHHILGYADGQIGYVVGVLLMATVVTTLGVGNG